MGSFLRGHYLDHAPTEVKTLGRQLSKTSLMIAGITTLAVFVLTLGYGNQGLVKAICTLLTSVAAYFLASSRRITYQGMFSNSVTAADTHLEKWTVSDIGWVAYPLAAFVGLLYFLLI